jgi:uncharacterized membrane protein YbhN (UPF0104 family)
LASWARLGAAVVLMGVILHIIFCNEAQLHLSESGQRWESLSKWDQRQVAWSRGPVELWRTVRRLDAVNLVLALALCGVPVVVGGLRWRQALLVQGLKLSVAEVTRVSFVSHFFNAFLLGSTGGDVVKAWCAARWTREKRAEAALTVVVDRLLGTLALLLFAALMIPMAWEAAPGVPLFLGYRRYQLVALLVAGMALVALVMVAVGFYSDLLAEGAPVARVLRRFPRGDSVVRALAACRLFGRQRGYLAKTAAWSLVINLAIVGTFVALASGLKLEVPLRVLWFVVPAVVCVAALPVTPSGIGVREHLFVSLLAIEAFPGVKHGEALALALLGYTANLVWSAVGGLVYLALPGTDAAKAGVDGPAGS